MDTDARLLALVTQALGTMPKTDVLAMLDRARARVAEGDLVTVGLEQERSSDPDGSATVGDGAADHAITDVMSPFRPRELAAVGGRAGVDAGRVRVLALPVELADAVEPLLAAFDVHGAHDQLLQSFHGGMLSAFHRHAVTDRAVRDQTAMLVEAQLRLEDEFGLLTSTEVAALARSTAKNRHATASRWEKDGAVFSVPWQRSKRYPGFQFDPGNGYAPRPAIAPVLEHLRRLPTSPWEVALWWTTRLGALGDERPVDHLDDVDALLRAADAEAEPVDW